MEYKFKDIELKQQQKWEKARLFFCDENGERENYYVLEMFAYPSGSMHMGHLRNYTLGDVIARYKRMKGYNVFHPFGWDSFGLPAENAAIERGLHPKEWTKKNISEMKGQLKKVGISYDWEKEISTCDEEYYRWNQWLFKKMYEKGLVYRKKAFVNWDVDSQTVLANEQVINGKSWRGGEVIQKELEQWFFKITDYSEQLLQDHKELEGYWPDRVLTMQKNWIGKSTGIEIEMEIPGHDSMYPFTTRLDTIYGISYVAISKGHPFAKKISLKNRGVLDFISSVSTNLEERKGIFTGHYAINPINGERLPIWVADYVLDYGGGAVIGVPSHDKRDNEFAKSYGIKKRCVISPLNGENGQEDYFEKGILVNSDEYSGMESDDAIEKIFKSLYNKGQAKKQVNFKLKDWLISRQRYWGTPIPAIYSANGDISMEEDSRLPITLPLDVDFSGGGNPLATAQSFQNIESSNSSNGAKRETDTMDTFVDSSWYYLRFLSANNSNKIFDTKIANKWSPVDLYIGGVEHAVMHLLYARFMHKVLRDLGLVACNEPFKKYLPQGMVLAHSYYDKKLKKYYSQAEVDKMETSQKDQLIVKMEKMSKSKNNGVEPDKIIEKYGADAARLFILFAAPPEKDLEWKDSGVNGTYKFIKRVWNFAQEESKEFDFNSIDEKSISKSDLEILNRMNITIRRVEGSLEESYLFNVAVAAVMEFFNAIVDYSKGDYSPEVLSLAFKNLLLLISPFAPHFTDVLWSHLGFKGFILKESWPTCDERWNTSKEVKVAVQVNGKLRGLLSIAPTMAEEEVLKLAKNIKGIEKYLSGDIKKYIYVEGKLLNFVV